MSSDGVRRDRADEGEELQQTEESAAAEDEASGPSLPANEELETAAREAAEAMGGDADEAARSAAVEALEQDLGATRDRLLRLQADFENYRKRTLREREEAFQYGHQNIVKDLLPTVDNLERAIEHARESGGGDLENFLQGVELVLRELRGVLERHGVQAVEAHGRPFDPELHEALSQVSDDSVPPNTVVKQLEKGYRIRTRLLRPARVIVSRRSVEGEGAEGGEEGSQS